MLGVVLATGGATGAEGVVIGSGLVEGVVGTVGSGLVTGWVMGCGSGLAIGCGSGLTSG